MKLTIRKVYMRKFKTATKPLLFFTGNRAVCYTLNPNLSVIAIVIVALFWSILPLLGWGSYALEPFRTSCTLDWTNPSKSYVTTAAIGCVFLPALSMAVSYCKVIQTVRSSSKRLARCRTLATNSARVAADKGLTKVYGKKSICMILLSF